MRREVDGEQNPDDNKNRKPWTVGVSCVTAETEGEGVKGVG